MSYDINFIERGDLKLHIMKFFLHPNSWVDPVNKIPFALKWSSVKFEDINQTSVPVLSGVYAFSVKPEYSNLFDTNYLFYIGKTNRNLRTRFGEYLNDSKGKGKPRQKIFEMMKMFKGHLHFNYAPITSKADVDLAEDHLINTFVPRVNVSVAKAKIKPEFQYLYE